MKFGAEAALVELNREGVDMGKLGKRLVFVLLSLSLTLMGVSFAVNATATDWKSKLKAQSEVKGRLSLRLEVLTKAIETEERELALAANLKADQDKSYGARLTQLNGRVAATKKTMDKTHTDYQASQNQFSTDLKVQEKISADLAALREQIAAVEKQKSEFDTQNQQLLDLVSELEREVAELQRARELLNAK